MDLGAPQPNAAAAPPHEGVQMQWFPFAGLRTEPVPFRSTALPPVKGSEVLATRAIRFSTMSLVVPMTALIVVGSLVCHMMQQDDGERGGHGGSFRDPPRWSPEMERRASYPYTFEA